MSNRFWRNKNVPSVWTPDLVEEILKFENVDANKSQRIFSHNMDLFLGRWKKTRPNFDPFLIETHTKAEKLSGSAHPPLSTLKSNLASSTIDSIRSHLSTRVRMVSNAFEKSKQLVTKSTSFGIDSAKSNSLGAKLLYDCGCLLQGTDNYQGANNRIAILQCVHEAAQHHTRRLTHFFFSKKVKLMNQGNKIRKSNQIEYPRSKFQKSILTNEERMELIERAEKLTENVLYALDNDKLWEKVNQEDGVTIWKTSVDVKNYHPVQNFNPDIDPDSATIRSEAILHASPQRVFSLFSDDDRAHEFNENCNQIEDLELISENCKINWSATGKFGPFAARDFVTLVSFYNLGPKQGYLSLCVSVEHPLLAPEKVGYVRSQIQLAATFMKPVEGQADKTRFVQVMQIGRLGGVADSPLARRIKANLQLKAPIEFIHKFHEALERKPSDNDLNGHDILTTSNIKSDTLK